MKNLIVSIIVILIIALACIYIIRQKKKGVKCIGCPFGAECSSKSANGMNCGCQIDEKK